MNTRNNRQFQNSDVRMKSAMLELIDTMPFEKITVRLICERAGVNRSTFYAHYMDIYDMIEQMETNLQKKLMDSYHNSESVIPLSEESFLTLLAFIREHKEFYGAALKIRWEFPMKQGFETLWNQVVQPLSRKAGITSENEMLLYFIGFQASFTMILKFWVDRGCEESIEKIARIIQNMIPAVWRQGER